MFRKNYDSLEEHARQLDESTQARLTQDQTPAGTEALPEGPPRCPRLTETIHLDAAPLASIKTANLVPPQQQQQSHLEQQHSERLMQELSLRMRQTSLTTAKDQRPPKKFKNGTSIQFRQLMGRFYSAAASQQGMTPKDKLIELAHWFEGTANIIIEAYISWNNAEEAYHLCMSELETMRNALLLPNSPQTIKWPRYVKSICVSTVFRQLTWQDRAQHQQDAPSVKRGTILFSTDVNLLLPPETVVTTPTLQLHHPNQ